MLKTFWKKINALNPAAVKSLAKFIQGGDLAFDDVCLFQTPGSQWFRCEIP